MYILHLAVITRQNWLNRLRFNILFGSVAVHLRNGGIFSGEYIANLLVNLSVKEF